MMNTKKGIRRKDTMKALFIGGTGTISTEISKLLVREGWELTLLNRGHKTIEGAEQLLCDI